MTNEHTIRLRLGPFGRVRLTLRGLTPAEAARREAKLREVAQALVAAGHGEHAIPILRKAESAVSADAFRATMNVAERLCAGKVEPKSPRASKTFRQIGEWWTSGDAHRQFPDHVREKDHRMDIIRLERLYGVDVGGMRLGDVPIDRFTLDHAQAAMSALDSIPRHKFAHPVRRPATRRHYAQVMNRVLSLAVWPLRLIETNPLPRGFMPRVGKPPAYPYLRPTEDAALMACVEVPFEERIAIGFLAREGMRTGEMAGLQWCDLDLEVGAVTLTENKTDDPRSWALDPGVARALRIWRKRREPKPGDAVFIAPNGGPFQTDDMAKRLRGYLSLAGVTRPELLRAKDENTGALRAHDLRGTFVTLALANGRTETWVADRTGHKSSQMINRYRRQARQANELHVGELIPLDRALPEFASEVGQQVGQKLRAPPDSNGRPADSKSDALSS